MSRTPDQYVLARKLLANQAEAPTHDEWGGAATRTDIVQKPPRKRPAPAALPDPEDPTVRMSPDRVLALLKGETTVPEPLEATPGHTPTRVFDPEEVSSAQQESLGPPASHTQASPSGKTVGDVKSSTQAKSSPFAKSSPDHKRPFEVMESMPGRPPRAPKVPAEFSALEKEPAPRRSSRPALARRVKRAAGLVAMAIAVFMTTFLVTKGLRDESARLRAWEFISALGARVGGWFSSQAEPPKPKKTSNVLPQRPDSKSAPARSSSTAAASAALTATSSTPVVRLEDLAVLEECTGAECAGAASQTKRVSERKPRGSRAR